MMLFSQQLSDPTGGWASLVLQGGALLLLAYLVMVVFPAYQHDITEERKEHAKERERRDKDFTLAIKDQTVSIVTELKEGNKTTRDALAYVCHSNQHRP